MPTCDISTAEFLSLFHGTEPVHFRVFAKNKPTINRHGRFEDIGDDLRRLNDNGYRVCFIVNSGGTKKAQISKINAFYADFDDQSKEEALEILRAFELQPTILVESKRSIHPYWLLAEPYSGDDRVELFQSVQKGLIARFDSDPMIYTPERVMGLPGFVHRKKGHAPFLVRVMNVSGILYEAEDFEDQRAEGHRLIQAKKSLKNRSKGGYKVCIRKNTNTLVTPLVPFEQRTVHTQEEAIDALLRVDLRQHLGLADNCCCPLHDDSNPSACIYQADDGAWLLTCHASSSCGTNNIIKLTMALSNSSFSQALQSLMDQYGVAFDDSIIQANLIALDPHSLRSACPTLYQSIRWQLPLLAQMNEFIGESYRSLGLVDADDRPCVMASYRYLSTRLNIPLNRLRRKLKNLAYFGLIVALPDGESHPGLVEWARACGQMGRRASIWSIPSYTPQFLQVAEQRAIRAKAEGQTVASRTSREAQQRLHGYDEALRISPQAKDDLHMDTGYQMLKRTIESLVKKRGYFRESEALEILRWKTEGQRRLTKQLRPSLISDLGLARVQLNKQRKADLEIEWPGYPAVWMPK